MRSLTGGPLFGRSASPLRFAAIFTSAMAVGLVGQVVWLAAGSRAMSRSTFGTILAAQALYGVLQFIVDNGSAFHGARITAAGQLDAESRGSILRLRLQLAAVCGAIGLAVSALGGTRSLLAVAFFVPALFLFALLPYWESFGRGESGPWSAYVILRSALPATAAVIVIALGLSYPLPLVGLTECLSIALVAVFFRLPLVGNLRTALGAARGPWRAAYQVSLPTIMWQVGLAAGTVTFGLFGAAAAAATFGVATRLVTGVNQIGGALATSLYPGLARDDNDRELEDDFQVIGTVLRAMLLISAAATAALAAWPRLVNVLLANATPADEHTAVLMVSGSAATGFLILLTLILIARRLESIVARPYAAGNALIVAGGILIATAGIRDRALWMAVVFVVGQLLCVLLLARPSYAHLGSLGGNLRLGIVAAGGFAAGGILSVAVPDARIVVVCVFAALALVSLCSVLRRLRPASVGA